LDALSPSSVALGAGRLVAVIVGLGVVLGKGADVGTAVGVAVGAAVVVAVVVAVGVAVGVVVGTDGAGSTIVPRAIGGTSPLLLATEVCCAGCSLVSAAGVGVIA
jgi:hypothetical protein